MWLTLTLAHSALNKAQPTAFLNSRHTCSNIYREKTRAMSRRKPLLCVYSRQPP